MRICVKQDYKIQDDESKELQRQLIDFYYEHTKIVPEFYIEKTDYSSYPTYLDEDGDAVPTSSYLQAVGADVYKRYGDFGVDHIVLLVHEDNWQSSTPTKKGIWGSSYSNLFKSYQIQYVRYDKDNSANAFGIFYHELMHSHDSLIKTTLGVDINPIVGVQWDKFCVHGGRPDKEGTTEWKYIKWKENTKALDKIGPYLYKAYEKRRELHRERVGLMKQVISLAGQLVVLYRAKLNKKKGIPR